MNEANERLLECPFCGEAPFADKGERWVTCESCGVQTPFAAWNRRAALSPERRRELAEKIDAAELAWQMGPEDGRRRVDVIYDALTEALGATK